MKKRITAVCVLAAVATFLFAACGDSEDGKITTTTQQQTTTVKNTTSTTANRTDNSSGEGMLDKASEKLSEGMTELKSDVSRMMR
ncbi:MAG: hypothetical protein IJA02_05595 [Clostridia bacterium]|nr:hypothetical protein [Clostridia bacterium]MBR6619960.1 hypothetical protein [Clostridia bacterium]